MDVVYVSNLLYKFIFYSLISTFYNSIKTNTEGSAVWCYGEASLFNLFGKNLCAMDDGQHIDLILLSAINYAIGFFDQLADVFSFILGDFPAGKRLCGDLL